MYVAAAKRTQHWPSFVVISSSRKTGAVLIRYNGRKMCIRPVKLLLFLPVLASSAHPPPCAPTLVHRIVFTAAGSHILFINFFFSPPNARVSAKHVLRVPLYYALALYTYTVWWIRFEWSDFYVHVGLFFRKHCGESHRNN